MKQQWFHILVVLTDDSFHGAEIQRRVEDATGGRVKLYPVTLYRALDDLAAADLIREVDAPADVEHKEKRRYFAITADGRAALASEAEALEGAARMARAALEPSGA